ncbi:PH domain-containing protein [Halorientalis brevis]|uniref:PH domain-containing protein n=1 Tax=Halorientalis brevis TaxID=1126241 RepID=A0ABD6CA64_9EURY|nr:PH domain-containing protein [Halorientalis brevis]
MVERPGWASLEAEETIQWTGRPVVYPALSTVAKALAVAAIGLGVWLAGEGYVAVGPSMPASAPATLIGSLLAGIGVMGAVTPLLGWAGVGYLVTDEAVYRKRGLLFGSVESCNTDRVRSVTVAQPMPGDLFSYGRVHLASPDGEFVLRHVSDPADVAATISAQCDGASPPTN